MTDNKLTWISHQRFNEYADYNLICFPYAGGSATYFAPLKANIDKKINVCPVLYPCREKNSKCSVNFETIEEMAEVFAYENAYLFDKNFAFLGHCTGTLVAYETALAVKRIYGKNPSAFFASSAPAPSCEQFFLKQSLSEDELTEYLLQNKMINNDFVNNPIYSSYFMPLMRNDLNMHLKYEPKIPYAKICTSVNVLYGDEDALFTNNNAINEWENFTDYGVKSSRFCGGHFYLDSCRTEVGKLINSTLIGE